MQEATLTIAPLRPDAADALALLAELDAELNRHDYPPESRHAFSVEKLLRQAVSFSVAYADGSPVGCGGVKLFPAPESDVAYGEVKRMYLRPAHRGRGVGRAVLRHLADFTRSRGVGLLRLETGIYQSEALRLYERFGFLRRGPFGEYREDPLSVYLELPLT